MANHEGEASKPPGLPKSGRYLCARIFVIFPLQGMPRVEEELLQSRPFRSDKERLIVTIMRTHAWICEQLQHELEPYGITQQQYNVLRILRGSAQPLSTCDIRRRMIDRASDTSRIVDRLVEKGLVEKHAMRTTAAVLKCELPRKVLLYWKHSIRWCDASTSVQLYFPQRSENL